uniref:RNA-directed DNA polymerase, eukaryota, reverse transcriptase zinc-binding domain protein n=1 Tax=Tanacetum cinerariifolium TaxID=118510 RepID=A0A6L2LGD6_TANCI|nr:RNA-directed DNA polymerase, eukaryota, reverse transcriptase zinc-binding domain protein [Tanacetum cinerariifolium]
MVLDVYISLKVTKLGKRFAFARFNKVNDVDLLIKNLRSVWLGPAINEGHDVLVLVLERGLLNYEGDPVLVGCVRDFKSLPNIHTVCSSEGFPGLKISYLGGFWILLEFDSFQSCEKFQSHEGIKSWFSTLSQWTSNFEIQDRVVWIDNEGKVSIVRAKEVTGWVPEFGEGNFSLSDDASENYSEVKHDLKEEEDNELLITLQFSPKEASNNVVDDGITDYKSNNNSYSGSKQDHTDPMDQERKRFQESLIEIDLRLDQGVGLPDDLLNHAKIVRDLQAFNKKYSIDLAQKAKVKWAIEGNENTKFLHGVVNKKRRYLAIKGILNDDQFPRRLSIELSRYLERDVNSDEIKKAVWDCRSDKSPVKEFFSSSTFPNGFNPLFIALIPKVLDAKHLNDFRPISLVGCQYKIIGKILANRLSLVIDNIISQEQSAFVKGRQIMDGPIILNEVISWCKSKNEQSLLFKVDFQKAFNSVRWDHLDDIFCSPTDEFTFHRGLSIFGVGVRPSVVCNMVVRYGCIASTLSFTYLGIKVGANMKRISSWDVVIIKVTSKLSTWKAKSLSVGETYSYQISLWLNVIKAIYGYEGSVQLSLSNQGCSVWSGIIQAIKKLKTKGIDLYCYCNLVVGNGHSINFWQDKWYSEVPFKDKLKRCFNLDLQKDISVALKLHSNDIALSFRRRPISGIEESQFCDLNSLLASIVLSDAADRWSWTLYGHGECSVKLAREVIDQHVLIISTTPTRWSKVIPIKLNIFMWCMLLDKLPTRSNLVNRGLDAPCSLCLICQMGVETQDHLFFGCPMALDLFRLLGHWWSL